MSPSASPLLLPLMSLSASNGEPCPVPVAPWAPSRCQFGLFSKAIAGIPKARRVSRSVPMHSPRVGLAIPSSLSVVQGQTSHAKDSVCSGSGRGTCGLWQVLVECLAEMVMGGKSAERRNRVRSVAFPAPPGAAPSPLGVPMVAGRRGLLPPDSRRDPGMFAALIPASMAASWGSHGRLWGTLPG